MSSTYYKQQATIKKCAKALYLLGSLEHMMVYLDAMVEANIWLEQREADAITDQILAECAPITMGEINKLRAQF